VPGTKQEDVKVLQYADRLKIYRQRTLLAEYPLPADGVKNAHSAPRAAAASLSAQASQPRLPARGTAAACPGPGGGSLCGLRLQTPGIQRHRFLRELFALSRKVTPAVFAEALTGLDAIAWCRWKHSNASPGSA